MFCYLTSPKQIFLYWKVIYCTATLKCMICSQNNHRYSYIQGQTEVKRSRSNIVILPWQQTTKPCKYHHFSQLSYRYKHDISTLTIVSSWHFIPNLPLNLFFRSQGHVSSCHGNQWQQWVTISGKTLQVINICRNVAAIRKLNWENCYDGAIIPCLYVNIKK